MSGGYFNYNQYRIDDIIDTIEKCLNRQGTPRPDIDLIGMMDYYDKYPEEKNYCVYSEEVQKIMLDALEILKTARIYVHRLDWFLSRDDGEENFINRLKQVLEKK